MRERRAEEAVEGGGIGMGEGDQGAESSDEVR